MGLRINQNIAAQNAYRNLSITDSQMSKSLEKLSSGFRINRAADDAAGLSISEGLRSQIGGLKVAVRNTQDGVSVAQTAEGSLNEVTSILQRMRDLAVQASNSGATDADAAAAANKEMSQLNAELDRIGSTTAFGKQKLLDGTFGATVKTHFTDAATNSITTDSGKLASLDPTGKIVAPTRTAADGITPVWGFSLTQVAGLSKAPNDTGTTDLTSTPIAVEIPALASDATPQDVAKAVNSALSDALKARGFQGNEITMSVKVDANNATTYSMSGAGDFTVDDTADGILSGAPAVAAGATVNTGGLGIDLTTALDTTGGNKGAFQVGANANQKINIQIGAVDSQNLGTAALDLTSDPDTAITVLDKALQSVSDSRASLGAYQNRFDHTINNLNVAVENLSASESRIRDTDMAQEMVSYTRAQILTQAGTSMLSQANQSAQNVLSLLR
ncbi:flagellin N-terminal helical domain-containing protein [Paractinoplanes globisporus]|uniref:Flagellin n=2 Tax=Paractinoplanes globisporus TaxID=113565 RepID=A0ABW6WT30_9ACTN|nr:flagellin [Actinoplanes globisporus]